MHIFCGSPLLLRAPYLTNLAARFRSSTILIGGTFAVLAKCWIGKIKSLKLQEKKGVVVSDIKVRVAGSNDEA
jgi:hypothetical protein